MKNEISVYNFSLPDPVQDAFVDAKGKCTLEKIKSMHGKPYLETLEIIDSSLLNETGRYHEK